ncbi:alpha/beta hydrolase [Kribbella shirazensis]|uniref:2-hydroxymuconate-semialdehyde hydrolase n=1 Tax=Kribbella shirazensis TaxID=1105143 RepID=A0A7X5ZZR5_9ACTN|nr:2-hydroxymuconate-semialdehyde hydrolase [Kribbella shirazensis]
MRERERLLQGLPVDERRIDVDGVATVVLEGGSGAPLVLLHGGIECGGAYWAPVIPRLAEQHRLVVPDVPGLGESDPVARLDQPAFNSWLDELLTLTCDQPPIVVAHSLVGTLTAGFAASHGERLQRLVLYGVPGVGPYRMPIGLRTVAVRFALRPSEANMERFERWAFADLDAVRRRNPDWMQAFTTYTRSHARVPHGKRTMRYLVTTCTKQVRAHSDVPTMLIWGAKDRFVPLALAEEAARRLDWPLRVIEDAGHVPHIERPAAFLEEVTRTRR